MVTEKKLNLKKALFPFFNFLVLDQKIFLNINNDVNLNFDVQKQFKNKLNSNNYFRESELITFNKENINELSLNLMSNIKDRSLIISNEKEITFNSKMSLFDLMSFYRVLLSKNFASNIKIIEKVYSNEKEFFNFNDINQKNHKSNEIIEKKITKK